MFIFVFKMINLRQNGTGQKLNIDTSPLYQHIHSLETNTSFLQHQIKSMASQNIYTKKINITTNLLTKTTITDTNNYVKINAFNMISVDLSDYKTLKFNADNISYVTFQKINSLKLNIKKGHKLLFNDVNYIDINCDSILFNTISTCQNININAIFGEQLTFNNVKNININCVSKPDILCFSDVGTVYVNHYDSIYLQNFDLFKSPSMNTFFYKNYIPGMVSTSSDSYRNLSPNYTMHGSQMAANVRFSFDQATFTHSFVRQLGGNPNNTHFETVNIPVLFYDSTIKSFVMPSVFYDITTGTRWYTSSFRNVMLLSEIQFGLPYQTTTFSNYILPNP